MPSAYDLYTFYLEAAHLRGKSVVVHISAVTVEEVYNPRIKRNEKRLVCRFHGKKLALCLNKSQAGALIELTGADDYTRWIGHSVMLTPAMIDRERMTITITAPAAAAAAQPGPAQPAAATAQVDGDESAAAADGEDDPVTAGDFPDHEEA